jgi:hypothetical protein
MVAAATTSATPPASKTKFDSNISAELVQESRCFASDVFRVFIYVDLDSRSIPLESALDRSPVSRRVRPSTRHRVR